ncbi:unnamed protein product [Adineta steineri]|uniref:Uncharacterized protein n=1 Tax=Adineta steineri TaxID=433720 RepID=A0A819X312_9BILA|nr:unnamed protein product [Adineta steineri]CAF4135860.1 unnamed protein product [Adineta steineri]CAF4142550.1 unnamed protein product [Adineta steineri]
MGGEVKSRYADMPQQAVSTYTNTCDICQTRRSFHKPVSGKSIISIGFLTRLQVDLIDMRSIQYGSFNFIIQFKDHFTKFSWLCPSQSKEPSGVAANFKNLFYTFKPPKTLQ